MYVFKYVWSINVYGQNFLHPFYKQNCSFMNTAMSSVYIRCHLCGRQAHPFLSTNHFLFVGMSPQHIKILCTPHTPLKLSTCESYLQLVLTKIVTDKWLYWHIL
jgi:hypothetical protein